MRAAHLREVGPSIFAYFQPDGAWGLSNAGLVVAATGTLLVDTLFDYAHTRRMLEMLAQATDRARHIDVVVNTHANGDHCYGNALLSGSRIIASAATRQEMLEMQPKQMARLMSLARTITGLGSLRRPLGKLLRAMRLNKGADLVTAAPYALRAFERFDFGGINLALPTETFNDQIQLEMGDRVVELIKLGPAHTQGDAVALIADARVLFVGDILFSGLHPLVWAGSISHNIAACERILSMGADTIVPGHGPLMSRHDVAEHVDYFTSLLNEVRQLVASGVSERQASVRLMRMGFGARALPERLAVNVNAAYREVQGRARPNDFITLFAEMARLCDEQP